MEDPEAIRKQIALLQAKLEDSSHNKKISSGQRDVTPERGTVLVPATPSPKKKRKLDHAETATGSTSRRKPSRPAQEHFTVKPAPSNLLANLSKVTSQTVEKDDTETTQRSGAFTDRPCPPTEAHSIGLKRDDRLALIEDLEPGPVDHKAPFDDPNFETFEPNSGIRLSSRSIPHEDLQDHLRGRYYLSPSHLYSCIRLLPNKQGYDVPVPGDWITIAVVAERGPVRFSKGPAAANEDQDKKSKGKGKEEAKPLGRRYVNMRLIDFGSRSKSSATGGKAVIRGDAMLSLLLFEAESFDVVEDENGRKRKLYRGGSRGAYEHLTKVKEGDVIALLNPRILKPFQKSADSPHPQTNILAVTPESDASIMVIGCSKDLGMCKSIKRDGKRCGAWCDKRVSEVCDYHVQTAVQKSRSGRAEFTAGTSGFGRSAVKRKREPDYDPARQWGLKPEHRDPEGNGATYVVSGHVIKNTQSSLYIAENVGREGQAKAQRISAKKEDQLLMKALLERDKEGMKAVVAAREVVERKKDKGKKSSSKDTKTEKKKVEEEAPTAKHAYSATTIRKLGFDPVAMKTGIQRKGVEEIQDKLNTLHTLRSKRSIQLASRPGEKIRSGVTVPKNGAKAESAKGETSMIDLDDD